MTDRRMMGKTGRSEAKDFGQPSPQPTPENMPELGADPVVLRITKAMRLGRLKPGTKLSETMLADIFGTSRNHVRQAFLQLATKGLVKLIPNRGAFVSKLSTAEARQLFAARRIIEASTVALLSQRCNAHASELLEAHITREREAIEARDVMEMLIIAGDFHVLIATLAGNDVLKAYVEDLVLRTALVISEYPGAGAVHCSCHAHHQLAELMKAGDEKAAVDLMLRHIDELEEPLLARPAGPTADLRAIFADV